jgi:hypothetical protein
MLSMRLKALSPAQHALNTIFAENTLQVSVKGYKINFFLPVRKWPTQIGFDSVRNLLPKFSCFCPFKLFIIYSTEDVDINTCSLFRSLAGYLKSRKKQ